MKSGIYFRVGSENICFEDLYTDERNKIIDSFNDEAKKRLIHILADTINMIEYENQYKL